MLAIHWSPPYDTGGYPIERYIIEKREATHSHWTQVGSCPPDVTAFCVTDLAENQTYHFRVVAETAYGFSEPLELDKPVVPRRIFEMAPMMEIESWLKDDRATAAAIGTSLQEYSGTVSTSSALFQYALQTVSSTSRTTSTAAERAYSAYADEPLTATHDTIASTEAWLSSRRY